MLNYDNIVDFRSKKSKKEELKDKFKKKLSDGRKWVSDNKELLIVAIPIAAGAIKIVAKRCNLNKAEEIKENYCYDRSLGHYWQLRRKLSNDEWLEIDNRKKNGERLGDILEELKVLK